MVNNFCIKNLIESWGSIRRFAEEIGCSYEAARKMRDRNSISPKYWNIIIQVSKSKGLSWVTLDWFLHNYANKYHRGIHPITKSKKDMLHLMKKFSTPAPTDNNEHQQQHSHS
ncbi:hypothetical protein MNL08_03730 [Bartonella krasnovii]|uniref:Putative prophage protein n=1 Tax=Bartonella krasnovii TaxID=2267275 RepID=A0A5B9D1M0_9HYPH|nr:hypothetical protein [Bartonella krasnovii]QEE12135.1 putative prophage protein [Bartonella krasnovii]UNF37688.1 hypothetical protein MNL11_02810 [Bartonella krasnovii]UNF42946.1 hypothetical protein MNL08_03730 [Bartonella krasnovii]UNF56157.1 hypothetical protein MNL00_03740 [Bartonella krasnovii]